MKDKTNIVLICFGGIIVVWLALIIAPFLDCGLIEIAKKLPEKINTPLNIEFCKDSFKTVFIFICIYILGIGIYYSTRRNYRRGEEYGSAVWGNAKYVNKKYIQKPDKQNKILTQNVKIGLKAQNHRRNLNTLVCGRKSEQEKQDFLLNPILCNAIVRMLY